MPIGGHKDKLWSLNPSGSGVNASQYVYQAADSDDQYVFGFAGNENVGPQGDYTGHLQQIRHRNGWVTHFTLDPASLVGKPRTQQVTNAFGHRLVFGYTVNGQIGEVSQINPAGNVVAQTGYLYDSGQRLVQVTHADNTIRTFHYEDINNPNWLTGYSLNGQRVTTYRYNDQGRAIESTRSAGIDRYQVDYTYSSIDYASTGVANEARVIDPLGTKRRYLYSVGNQVLTVTGASYPPVSEAVEPIANRSVDADGLVVFESDFVGSYRTKTFDPQRQLPTTVSEGNGTHVRNITWHPTFRLPTQIDETDGRRTVNSYDERGNLTEQVVTDTTRSSSQVWKWTYNAAGLMASQTDPLGHTSSYAYDSAGQMTRSTNPLGHVTQYGYDAAGRVNRITDPNGVVVTMGHDARGRLTSRQQTGQGTESYSYHAHGGLDTVSLPNGQQLSYHYDAAERLIRVQSNWGSQVHYTLDAMGNRIKTEVKDAQGNTVYAQSQLINALNRIEKLTVGEPGAGGGS